MDEVRHVTLLIPIEYRQQVGKAIKKFFKGWKKRREIQDMRNENFDLHIRRRRFISKILCEGLVGGGCSGKYDT